MFLFKIPKKTIKIFYKNKVKILLISALIFKQQKTDNIFIENKIENKINWVQHRLKEINKPKKNKIIKLGEQYIKKGISKEKKIELEQWQKGISTIYFFTKDNIFKDSEQSDQTDQKLKKDILRNSKEVDREELDIEEENKQLKKIFDQFK